MNTYEWYTTLLKPEWAPPSWVFGPVWSILYVIIAITLTYIIYAAVRGDIPKHLAVLCIANLIFNLAFTPLQFGLQSNILASFDILLVLGTLGVLIVTLYPYLPVIALLNVPYLLWVSFATVLQLTITYLNW
jgi:translocator protein